MRMNTPIYLIDVLLLEMFSMHNIANYIIGNISPIWLWVVSTLLVSVPKACLMKGFHSEHFLLKNIVLESGFIQVRAMHSVANAPCSFTSAIGFAELILGNNLFTYSILVQTLKKTKLFMFFHHNCFTISASTVLLLFQKNQHEPKSSYNCWVA